MKLHLTPARRRIGLALIATAIIAVIFGTSLSSCSRKVMTNEEAAVWISAYTPSFIDAGSSIRIELTDSLIECLDYDKDYTKAFKFSPSVDGHAQLSDDNRFLDFIPSESLKQGQEYECRLRVDKLTGDDDTGDFVFKFVVAQRALSLCDVKVKVDPDDTSKMKITGRISCSIAPTDSVTGGKQPITCSWPGAEFQFGKTEGNSRSFTISEIRRGTTDGKLTIYANPSSGFSGSSMTVDIPSIDQFVLLDVRSVETDEPYFELEFSSPLSSQQDLDGLIYIREIPDVRIERYGTTVRLYYPPHSFASITLCVSDLIKNQEGQKLESEYEEQHTQQPIAPAVKLAVEGNILPDNDNLILPFRAVNLAAVDVEVVEIFPANVMSFLQDNDLDDTYGPLRRFGRLIYRRTVRLDSDPAINLHQWQDFSIDLKGLFRKERNAIYSVRLTFRKAYSLYGKSVPDNFEIITEVSAADNEEWDKPESYIYREAPDYDWHKYNWDDVKDPSKDTYYMRDDYMPEIFVVATNLGLIAKTEADKTVKAIVTDIITARPLAGIEVTAYNFQLQKIASATTDASGFATLHTTSRPFMLTASDGTSVTYLKMEEYNSLSTSNFDVSGVTVTEGVKGFVYGDRGVWRPGDNVHLTLILEDKGHTLPASHPVVMELYSPSDVLYTRQTLNKGVDGFYAFDIPTDEDMATGAWYAKFKVGNNTFTHTVRIETIKPNRLKINISAPAIISANHPDSIGVDVRWLTGAVAKGMRAKVDMTLHNNPTPFSHFNTYTFSNPLVDCDNASVSLLDGTLDDNGHLRRKCTVGADINAPGVLIANVTAQVTEPGGDASLTSKSIPFSPFDAYIGIDISSDLYLTGSDIRFPVTALNNKGQKLKKRSVEYKIYRLGWEWWWEGSTDELSRYVKSSSADMVKKGEITVTDGIGEIPFKVVDSDYGRYLIIARDLQGGHATGGIVTIDSTDHFGRSADEAAAASSILPFSIDKKEYAVGEKAIVTLPRCEGGRVLLSIENGTRVIRQIWVNTSATDETAYHLTVDKDMAPNFYIAATMLRPHKATVDKAPIRLFGIASANVVDRNSVLHPVIEMPDELHPMQQFTIKIKERDNRPMTYTLAIVDEGLLDITGFRTPRPWDSFNQREALGVATTDMYDRVIGAFGARFPSVLSIGGDEALRKSAGKEKRFNPVVRFIGPVTLTGNSDSHTITLPNYVGSLRVMVVAAHDGSYGNTDFTAKVTSPVMLLTSLPRTLACGDTATMPVNIFTSGDGIGNVAVKVSTQGPVKVAGAKQTNVTFKAADEKILPFTIVCSDSEEGQARIIVSASGGNITVADTTYINVSNPMPVVVRSESFTLSPGESTDLTWNGSSAKEVSLQFASMPSINFDAALSFMENYQHLCTEQLSSKALFMLYGRKFLNDAGKRSCETQIPAILRVIATRQLPDGGFAYWPGLTEADEWVTSMAGIVMSEALRQGYAVDADAVARWAAYQDKKSRDYRYAAATASDQAMRLYSLALGGKANKGAMNRLRESKQLTQQAAYLLAAAYAADGRSDVTALLADRAERSAANNPDGKFASTLCDKAFATIAYLDCDRLNDAIATAQEMASECNGYNYVTQDIAFASMALRALSDKADKGTVQATVTKAGNKKVTLGGICGVSNLTLTPADGKVKVTNTGTSLLCGSLMTAAREAPGCAASGSDMKLFVNYTTSDGKPISIDNLPQNTDLNAVITVINNGKPINSAALTYAIPSGWEIWNDRLLAPGSSEADYCDIRDDKVRYYFPLDGGERRSFTLKLRPAYFGSYILPPAVCEDMYHPARVAVTQSKRVMVSEPKSR